MGAKHFATVKRPVWCSTTLIEYVITKFNKNNLQIEDIEPL